MLSTDMTRTPVYTRRLKNPRVRNLNLRVTGQTTKLNGFPFRVLCSKVVVTKRWAAKLLHHDGHAFSQMAAMFDTFVPKSRLTSTQTSRYESPYIRDFHTRIYKCEKSDLLKGKSPPPPLCFPAQTNVSVLLAKHLPEKRRAFLSLRFNLQNKS